MQQGGGPPPLAAVPRHSTSAGATDFDAYIGQIKKSFEVNRLALGSRLFYFDLI
jgi:hypothetical protein